MAADTDPYRTLGLSRGASLDEVKRAYRRLVKIDHPDAAGEAALPRFLAIQAAYDRIAGPLGEGPTGTGRRPGTGPTRAWELRALVEGSVGKIKDFYVFRSQFVQKTGSAPAATHNIAFSKDAIGLVTRRLPQPLLGTGAIAEYAEMGNFGVRVLMSYAPNTLAQQFTVDVLYGCAVLRNAHGVQVTT